MLVLLICHCTELIQLKYLSIESGPLLGKDHRRSEIFPDQQGCNSHNGTQGNKSQRRTYKILRTFNTCLVESFLMILRILPLRFLSLLHFSFHNRIHTHICRRNIHVCCIRICHNSRAHSSRIHSLRKTASILYR